MVFNNSYVLQTASKIPKSLILALVSLYKPATIHHW